MKLKRESAGRYSVVGHPTVRIYSYVVHSWNARHGDHRVTKWVAYDTERVREDAEPHDCTISDGVLVKPNLIYCEASTLAECREKLERRLP